MPSPVFPTLETPRLPLREIVPDLAAAAKLVEVFAGWRALPNPGTRWGIQVKGQTELVGTCGLFAWNRTWRKCTLGYELVPGARGQGLMHEALRACLAWGFEHMQLNRVEAQVHPLNAASLRSVERLGFVREGLLRQVGYWGGQYHDMHQCALLRQDWPVASA